MFRDRTLPAGRKANQLDWERGIDIAMEEQRRNGHIPHLRGPEGRDGRAGTGRPRPAAGAKSTTAHR